MILKGSQRSGGSQLAAHLMKVEDNEHVNIHELRGFMSDDLHSAFKEVHAISKGTRAKQFLFSLSLNPPPEEKVPVEVFEAAIEQIEQKLGLDDQPRAIVFHEKEGRRHAHVVWSRIKIEEMKAVNLPHYKMKLQDVSRELYLEHEWKMPAGLIDQKDRNPLNFTREEWQQSKRAGHHPKDIKRTFQECWAISDSSKAFSQALLSKGFVLARGDRRGYVALDYQGEAYSVARYAGVRTKAVKEKLGDPKALPSVDEAKEQIAAGMSGKLRQYLNQAEKEKKRRSAALEFKRKELVEKQRREREELERKQQQRHDAETKARAQRLSSGLKGIWHRLSGQYSRTKRKNEIEALLAFQRDRKEKDTLIFKHIQQRQQLDMHRHKEQSRHELELEQLRSDIRQYKIMRPDKSSKIKEEFNTHSGRKKELRKLRKTHKPDDGFEPEI